MTRFMLRVLSMTVSTREQVEILLANRIGELKHFTNGDAVTKVKTYLKAAFYKDFSVSESGKLIEVNIKGLGSGMSCLKDIELEFLAQSVQQDLVIHYFKIGKDKPDKTVYITYNPELGAGDEWFK